MPGCGQRPTFEEVRIGMEAYTRSSCQPQPGAQRPAQRRLPRVASASSEINGFTCWLALSMAFKDWQPG